MVSIFSGTKVIIFNVPCARKCRLICVSFLVSTSVVIIVGFAHSAFTFAYESLVIKSSMAQTEIPPGALITFLQKGLEYIAIEEHINEVRKVVHISKERGREGICI